MFASDARGVIDVDRKAPLSGSYRGVDGMGLFWSMRPDDQPKNADHISFGVDISRPIVTVIDVSDAGGVIASASVERRFAGADVRSIPIRDGVIGTLFEPRDGGPHPGVLVIGGSDGGPGEPGLAMSLASHGFAALSLSYFGEPGQPTTLELVPMEAFQRALSWMRRQPSIDSRFIGIYSESRGTEPGLFAAARDACVSAVIARSPSFALWGGVTANHLPGRPAWTLRGKPLPSIPNELYPDFVATYLWDWVTRTPVRQTPLFMEDLAHFGDTRTVEIPVEQIRGPVMLLSGEDDQIWPSAMMADRIMSRLHRFGHPFPDQSLKYAAVGHPIPYMYFPTRGRWSDSPLAVGGTPQGMANAERDAWPRILKFLSDAAKAPQHCRPPSGA